MASDTLQKLLCRAHSQFHIEYHGYLSNHLAHDLLSLHALGASDARLQDMYHIHEQHLEPRIPNPPNTINHENWKSWIGKRKYYDGYLQFFDGEIQKYGFPDTVKKYLPTLLPGLLGSATHPLIHLGYGVEFKECLVVAEGLAYAAHSFLDLSTLSDVISSDNEQSAPRSTITVSDVLRQISETTFWSDGVVSHNFQNRIKQVVQNHSNQLGRAIHELFPSQHTFNANDMIRQLFEASVTLYAARLPRLGQLDFFHLHAITSMHGSRQLLPLLSPFDQFRLLKLQSLALLLIHITQGRSPFDMDAIRLWRDEHDKSGSMMNWEDIKRLAIDCNDEHVCKLIYTLAQIDSVFADGNDLWRVAAYMTVSSITNTKGNWHYG